MTSKHVPLISAFKMIFRMVVFKGDLEGDLLSSSGQVRLRSGLVQVRFSLQLKFNSFELDSEVGRLVNTQITGNL